MSSGLVVTTSPGRQTGCGARGGQAGGRALAGVPSLQSGGELSGVESQPGQGRRAGLGLLQ